MKKIKLLVPYILIILKYFGFLGIKNASYSFNYTPVYYYDKIFLPVISVLCICFYITRFDKEDYKLNIFNLVFYLIMIGLLYSSVYPSIISDFLSYDISFFMSWIGAFIFAVIKKNY